jgi:hypothetical protein
MLCRNLQRFAEKAMSGKYVQPAVEEMKEHERYHNILV